MNHDAGEGTDIRPQKKGRTRQKVIGKLGKAAPSDSESFPGAIRKSFLAIQNGDTKT